MPDRAWKRAERTIAARLGGRRVPITGRQRGNVPDVEHPAFAVEVKSRKTLPTWLHNAMTQAIAARRGAQLPLVILHETGTRHADDLVLVRFGAWLAWFGDLPRPEGEDAA